MPETSLGKLEPIPVNFRKNVGIILHRVLFHHREPYTRPLTSMGNFE